VSINEIVAVTFELVMRCLLDGNNQVGRKSSVALISSGREDKAGVASHARLDLDNLSLLLFVLTDFSVVRNSSTFVFQFFSSTVVHLEQSACQAHGQIVSLSLVSNLVRSKDVE
jgi:hypothetical protein